MPSKNLPFNRSEAIEVRILSEFLISLSVPDYETLGDEKKRKLLGEKIFSCTEKTMYRNIYISDRDIEDANYNGGYNWSISRKCFNSLCAKWGDKFPKNITSSDLDEKHLRKCTEFNEFKRKIDLRFNTIKEESARRRRASNSSLRVAYRKISKEFEAISAYKNKELKQDLDYYLRYTGWCAKVDNSHRKFFVYFFYLDFFENIGCMIYDVDSKIIELCKVVYHERNLQMMQFISADNKDKNTFYHLTVFSNPSLQYTAAHLFANLSVIPIGNTQQKTIESFTFWMYRRCKIHHGSHFSGLNFEVLENISKNSDDYQKEALYEQKKARRRVLSLEKGEPYYIKPKSKSDEEILKIIIKEQRVAKLK